LKETLESCGYEVADAILSPHEFGIPQLRNRIYIVGALDGLKNFKFPEKAQKADLHINQILDKNPENAKRISNEQLSCLNIWQHILQEIPASEKLPSFPLWSMEWGATYPFEKLAPSKMSLSQIQEYRGNFGKSLKDAKNMEEALKMLPSYAQVSDDFPTWKIDYIKSNRDFFKKHKSIIRPYLKQLRKFPVSWQKLEWNCQNEERDLFKYILQFRASGIRVKRSNYSPALVVNTTQLPIIGWEQRYLTRDEAARLQDIYGIELPANDAAAFKALGNAINVHIIQQIAQNLIGKKRGPKKRIARKECVTEDLKCQAAL
jgi:DNA (cytosine-5)-methyltransferase 1